MSLSFLRDIAALGNNMFRGADGLDGDDGDTNDDVFCRKRTA